MSHKYVIKKCPHCRKSYKLGYNGIKGTCDTCAHIKRDAEGAAWDPWEKQITFITLDGQKEFTVTREEAFRGPYDNKYIN